MSATTSLSLSPLKHLGPIDTYACTYIFPYSSLVLRASRRPPTFVPSAASPAHPLGPPSSDRGRLCTLTSIRSDPPYTYTKQSDQASRHSIVSPHLDHPRPRTRAHDHERRHKGDAPAAGHHHEQHLRRRGHPRGRPQHGRCSPTRAPGRSCYRRPPRQEADWRMGRRRPVCWQSDSRPGNTLWHIWRTTSRRPKKSTRRMRRSTRRS